MKKFIDDNYEEIIQRSLLKIHLKDPEHSYEVKWDKNKDATFIIKEKLATELSEFNEGDIVRLPNVQGRVVVAIILSTNKESALIAQVSVKSSSGDIEILLSKIHHYHSVLYRPADIVLKCGEQAVEQLKALNNPSTIDTFRCLFSLV